MKWFKRGWWLAAWGVWVWCGFGLARELPRQPGRIVQKLTIDSNDDGVFGFVGDTNQLVVARGRRAKGERAIELHDVDAAKLIRRVSIPKEFAGSEFFASQFDKRHGVFFVLHFDPKFNGDGGDPLHGLNMLDVRTGDWRNIAKVSRRETAIHPEQPWIAFFETRPGPKRLERLVVYDFNAGKTLFEHDDQSAERTIGRPFFVPQSKTLVVPLVPEVGAADNVDFELWELEDTPTLRRKVKGVDVGNRPTVSANGRVAFGEQRPQSMHVFGINESSVLFSDAPPAGQSPGLSRPVVQISRSGERVIGRSPMSIWEVDSGREVWRPGDTEDAYGIDGGDYYAVYENWGKLWKRRFPTLAYSTWSLRRLDTCELLFRVESSNWSNPLLWNASGTLATANDGRVHRLPYVVNYPLLALCQTILALPLILLWAMLRWRHNRRLRLASVTP